MFGGRRLLTLFWGSRPPKHLPIQCVPMIEVTCSFNIGKCIRAVVLNHFFFFYDKTLIQIHKNVDTLNHVNLLMTFFFFCTYYFYAKLRTFFQYLFNLPMTKKGKDKKILSMVLTSYRPKSTCIFYMPIHEFYTQTSFLLVINETIFGIVFPMAKYTGMSAR